jgi:hypothetical protein
MPTKTTPITSSYAATPPDSALVGEGAARMREDREALVEVVAEEHNIVLTDASLEHGRHLPGSAVGYIVATAAALPTLRPNGEDALSRKDIGRLALVGPSALDTVISFIPYLFCDVTASHAAGYVVHDTTDDTYYGWRPIVPIHTVLDQELTTESDVVFAALTVDSIVAASASFSNVLASATQALRIRIGTPSPLVAGDIFIV